MAYTKITNFTAKDSLPNGDAEKIIYGADFDAEFNAIQTESLTLNGLITNLDTTLNNRIDNLELSVSGSIPPENLAGLTSGSTGTVIANSNGTFSTGSPIPTGRIFTKYQSTWSETVDSPGTHLIVTHYNTFISSHSGTSGTVYSARYGINGQIMTDPLFQGGGSAGYPTGNITRWFQVLVPSPNATTTVAVSWYYVYNNLSYTHGQSSWSVLPVDLS